MPDEDVGVKRVVKVLNLCLLPIMLDSSSDSEITTGRENFVDVVKDQRGDISKHELIVSKAFD